MYAASKLGFSSPDQPREQLQDQAQQPIQAPAKQFCLRVEVANNSSSSSAVIPLSSSSASSSLAPIPLSSDQELMFSVRESQNASSSPSPSPTLMSSSKQEAPADSLSLSPLSPPLSASGSSSANASPSKPKMAMKGLVISSRRGGASSSSSACSSPLAFVSPSASPSFASSSGPAASLSFQSSIPALNLNQDSKEPPLNVDASSEPPLQHPQIVWKKYTPDDASGQQIEFLTGNPCVEIMTGTLHLFRVDPASSNSTPPSSETPSAAPILSSPKSDLLCVLAVPAYLTPTDFIQFISPFASHMIHVRVLRDKSPNKYMALMRFSSTEAADSFYEEYNDKPFSSMDPEICHIVYVSGIEFVEARIASSVPAIPQHQEDEDEEEDLSSPSSEPSFSSSSSMRNTDVYKSSLCEPSESLTELPTCPVCLDRLDYSATGLFTALCNHSFHCECISKWGDSSCPVCRFTLEPDMTSQCVVCGSSESLWICLICGSVGCGRYKGGHAFEHFRRTQHTYAMELESQRVWDYIGDGYVHRLIQNKADGKLVELPDPQRQHQQQNRQRRHNNHRHVDEKVSSSSSSSSSSRRRSLDNNGAANDSDDEGYEYQSDHELDPQEVEEIQEAQFLSKLDAIGLEYNRLLSQQLDSQRMYFESVINKKEEKHRTQMEAQHEMYEALKHKYESMAAVEWRREKQQMEKKMAAAAERMKELEDTNLLLNEANRSLKDGQVLSHHHVQQQHKYEEQVRSLQRTIAEQSDKVNDLQEQLRDVMFYLETQKSVESRPDKEEIQQGEVLCVPGAASSSSGKKGSQRSPAAGLKKKR